MGGIISRGNDKTVEYTEEDYAAELQYEDNHEKNNEKENEENKEISETICQHRIGTITDLHSNFGLIDGKYYFDLDDLNNKHITSGQKVRYIGYKSNENSDWKVKEISCIEKSSWDNEDSPEYEGPYVTSENVAIRKTVTAKVIKKNGRNLILEPGNFHCNLNKIKSEFLPIEGDWVSLDALVEIRNDDKNLSSDYILEVEKLKPLRTMVYDGTVSHINKEVNGFSGIIDAKVSFTYNDCESNYLPAIKDKVVAKVIESEQGALTWRAISVLAVTDSQSDSFILSNIEEEKLFKSKNGVTLNPDCDNRCLKIGETTVYKVIIENCGEKIQTLTDGTLKNSKLKNTMMKITTDFNDPISIPPSECFTVTVEAKANFSGFFTDVLILNFKEDWKIGCLLDIFVDVDQFQKSSNKVEISHKSKQERRSAAVKKVIPTKIGFKVPGVCPIKPASFVPITLDNYPIPMNLKNIFLDVENNYRNMNEIETDLKAMFPFLMEELSEKNYLTKFHYLLHLEDLEISIAIKKYDKERTCFEHCGEYLKLQIPNLAESRPSLIIGDKLTATDPVLFNDSGIHYEGYIHKIFSDSIYIKFNDSFHSSYDGKDYSITFLHSRSSIRRCHQALNVVFANMSIDWLFPNIVKIKPHQVNIVGEFPALEDQKEITRICICDKINNDDKPKLKSFSKIRNHKSKMYDLSDIIADCKPEESNIKEVVLDLNDLWASCDKNGITTSHDYSLLNQKRNNAKIKWIERNSKRNENEADETKIIDYIPRDVVLKWVNKDLNRYQKDAVRNILRGEARPLPYIIFGPPGTGKTITVVETVLQLAFLLPESRILIATPSNSSADLICERLLSWNLLKPGDLVRIVGYNYMTEDRISSNLKPYCTTVDMKTEKNKNESYEENGIKHSTRKAIGRHKITVGTCVNVGQLYLVGFPRGHFTHVIVDEAGQATEPEILISLAFLSKEGQAILAGDPRQLGPVITCKMADNFGLGESLISRLLMRFLYHRDPESFPDTEGYDPRLVTWLLYNYRSLPDILNLYSSLFYDSKLKAMICSKCSREGQIFNSVKHELSDCGTVIEIPIIFCGIRGKNLQDEDSPSWYNAHEVAYVCRYLQALYLAGLKPEDIGIITPYQKQVHKIREMAKVLNLDVPKVGSVEEFQGQERNAIILSTVRSDEGLLEKDIRYSLGFVASGQRLNVAISRARSMLLIIGNPHLLIKDVTWRRLIESCVQKNCYIGCNLPSSLDNTFSNL